jgi:hypothetical protein
MAITMQTVRALLSRDEVNYLEAQRLGPEAIPFLKELVQGGDLNLASKAAYLASLIANEGATEVLEAAAARQEAVVRVAVAAGIRNLPTATAERVMDRLQSDSDIGVRRVMLNSVSNLKSPQLTAKVQKIAENDPEPSIRKVAGEAVEKMK